jgi:pyruvate-ferredoxin/flavodoxin oxidoreductase
MFIDLRWQLAYDPVECNDEGRGPSWSNSLFEDNAEFGLGMRLTLDKREAFTCELLSRCSEALDENLVSAILDANQSTEKGIKAQRMRVEELKGRLQHLDRDMQTHPHLMSTIHMLLQVADAFVRKSVWMIGGDGWAYDIGFSSLDHV